MEWKKTFITGQWVIHVIFTLSVLLAIVSILSALRLHDQQASEEKRAMTANSLLGHLRIDNSFDKIGKYLARAESEKANDKMRELSSKLVETEELLNIKVDAALGLVMRTFSNLVNKTSAISDPADAIKVLGQKVSQLSSFAEGHKYKNVGLIAQRMGNRIRNLSANNAGRSPLVGQLRSDIKSLEQVVTGSSLTEAEKNALHSRFQGMKNETELLMSLSSNTKDLSSHVKDGSLALMQWVLDAEKMVSDLKQVRGGKERQLIQLLASLIGFIVLCWIGLAYLFRWQSVRIGAQVEKEVKGVIEKGIMGDQRFTLEHYSETTRNDVIKLLDDLKVKLNLGTMLHEGLPFAGCMVDKNFRLTWHNHLFLEQFYLSEEEVRGETFSWDYLREYLNLEDDPVHQALVNKIAGIYSVRIKQDEYTTSHPYEMYVTPITINREERVMVFFYSLVSVKEAITDQVNLSKEVLFRFIQLWGEGRLNEDELRLLEKDFKVNDLSSLYQDLLDLHLRSVEEKNDFLLTIKGLESENTECRSGLEDMRRLEGERKELVRRELMIAGDLKDSFIRTLGRSESLLNINRAVLQQQDELKNEASKLQESVKETSKKAKETSEIMVQLESVKLDYKKLKLELLEVKAKLISINSSLFAQLPTLDEHQQKLAMRYKDELARLDFNVCTFDKKLSQLDVLLSKLHMMHEKVPMELQTSMSLLTSQKDHEMRDTLSEIQRAFAVEEGKIVEQFRSLQQLKKKEQELGHEIRVVSSTVSESFLS